MNDKDMKRDGYLAMKVSDEGSWYLRSFMRISPKAATLFLIRM